MRTHLFPQAQQALAVEGSGHTGLALTLAELHALVEGLQGLLRCLQTRRVGALVDVGAGGLGDHLQAYQI